MATTSVYIVANSDNVPSVSVTAPADGTTVLVREYAGVLKIDTVVLLLQGLSKELLAYAGQVPAVAIRLDLKTSA